MKITNEQIKNQLDSIEKNGQYWKDSLETQDVNNRKEFAKAFGWFKNMASFNSSPEPRVPTWTEIFVELGKVLAARNFMDFEGNISELVCRIEKIEKDKVEPPQGRF